MPGRTACRLCGRRFAQYGRARHRAYCKRCTARADREIARALRVKCKECGKKFAAPNRTVRYCSDECRAEGLRRYNREYQRMSLADPEKRAAAAARTRASEAARAARERGGRPPPPQRQAPPRASPNAEPSTCLLCGRRFAQYGRSSRHGYCRRCTAKADREIARTLNVNCNACGKKFSTNSRAVRYCSDECRAEGLRRSRRGSRRRAEADPEKRALAAARRRARNAARGSKARR